MILCLVAVAACQNSIPTVESLTSSPSASAAKDPKNFTQLSAGAQKTTLSGGYKGTLRISQPLGRLQATTADGHKLQGTVTLQR